MNRIDAWNHIIEELDAKTLENADGLTVNELLEMIYKNYKGSFDNFVIGKAIENLGQEKWQKLNQQIKNMENC